MKIYFSNNSTSIKKISFNAGVTNFYSDFDGTFMPHQYRHDVFCNNNANSPRNDFSTSEKAKFIEYFENFQKLLNTTNGKRHNKLKFTITTGRNLHEYNFFLSKIKEDGLSMPVSDKLTIRNGGDSFFIYKKNNFFQTNETEAFKKSNYINEKRNYIKDKSNGWDYDKIRTIIEQEINKFDIQKENKNIEFFECQTNNSFYGKGMHFEDKLDDFKIKPLYWVALNDNGNFEFFINFSKYLNSNEKIKKLSNNIIEKIEQEGFQIESKMYNIDKGLSYPQLLIKPLIEGKKINKLIDTKQDVENIIKNSLNDLVIVAGDDKNDIEMLNPLEYIQKSADEDVFSVQNLKKIYDLPLISIYVDNSQVKKEDSLKLPTKNIPFSEIDNYFNSDGNVRFIHVIPNNNVGKPQNLQEAYLIAIKEYAKRNEKFAQNLSPEMKKLITTSNCSYPINKTISEQLEQSLGTKLWNPSANLNIKNNKNISKKILLPLGIIASMLGVASYFYKSRNCTKTSLSKHEYKF